MKELHLYRTHSGRCPFTEWMKTIDITHQARIDAYMRRLVLGAAKKNIKYVGSGVYELKIDTGPGYRVYFAEKDDHIILLLLGGDKHRQSRDILKAQEYWRETHETN